MQPIRIGQDLFALQLDRRFQPTPLAIAAGRTESRADSTTRCSSIPCSSRRNFPEMIRDISSRSLTSCSWTRALRSMISIACWVSFGPGFLCGSVASIPASHSAAYAVRATEQPETRPSSGWLSRPPNAPRVRPRACGGRQSGRPRKPAARLVCRFEGLGILLELLLGGGSLGDLFAQTPDGVLELPGALLHSIFELGVEPSNLFLCVFPLGQIGNSRPV